MSSRSTALISLCVITTGIGIITADFGPLLLELAPRSGVPLQQAGVIVSLLFLGAALSPLAAGPLSDRLGRKSVLLFAMILESVATICLTFSQSFPVTAASAFLSGAGGGAVVLSTSVLLAEAFSRESVSALNIMNVFFGVGAFGGPALASLAMRNLQTGMPAMWIGAAVVLSQVPFVATLKILRPGHSEMVGADLARARVDNSSSRGGRPLFSPILWAFAAALFFSAATEQTLGGWIAVYMHQSAALSIAEAALVVSGFWISFTLGRLCAAGLSLRSTPRLVLLGSVLVLLSGITLVNLSAGRAMLTVAGFLLTGLGLGPVTPTIYALVGRAFPLGTGAAMGFAQAVGLWGAILFPWLAGNLMGRFGPATGVRVILLTAIAVASLSFSVRARAGGNLSATRQASKNARG